MTLFSPELRLVLINLFTGDIQGGLGPFLATWLASVGHWSPGRIGGVTTLVGLGALLLNGPAGAWADRSRRPRRLLAIACTSILVGTLLILPARGLLTVTAAQLLATAGGILLLPALTLFTLGTVGKQRFPRQQGRNQAANHAGILVSALLIRLLERWLGPGSPFYVLGAMSAGALAAVAATPSRQFNGRRAHGWQEDEPDEPEHRHGLLEILRNRRLLLLALALALFNLASGSVLALLGQRLVATGQDAVGWTAWYVITAQLTMIPVALGAGSLADRIGRRRLLLLACLALPARLLLCALTIDPYWLIPAELLDGLAAGLVGVMVPILVTDLTWGSGRTQTALGAVNTLQGLGGALSGALAGLLVGRFGWEAGFLLLGLPSLLAAAFAWWLQETRDAEAPYAPRVQAVAGE